MRRHRVKYIGRILGFTITILCGWVHCCSTSLTGEKFRYFEEERKMTFERNFSLLLGFCFSADLYDRNFSFSPFLENLRSFMNI